MEKSGKKLSSPCPFSHYTLWTVQAFFLVREICIFTWVVRPGFKFWFSFFFFFVIPCSVTNRRPGSEAHASNPTRTCACVEWGCWAHGKLSQKLLSWISRAMNSHTDEHTVCGRPTLKDIERFRNKSVCKPYERSIYERTFMSEPTDNHFIPNEPSNLNLDKEHLKKLHRVFRCDRS